MLEVLLPRLGNTCLLMGAELRRSRWLLALPAGILAALRPRSWLDYGLNLLAFAGISMPSFWLALLLILLVLGRARLAAGGRRAERRRSTASATGSRTSCCRC